MPVPIITMSNRAAKIMYRLPTRRPGADGGGGDNGEGDGDCTALPSRRGLIISTSSFQARSHSIVLVSRAGTLANQYRTRHNIKGCQLLNIVVNLPLRAYVACRSKSSRIINAPDCDNCTLFIFTSIFASARTASNHP